MAEVYFKGGLFKNRETSTIYYLMLIILITLTLLMFPGALIIPSFILEDFTKYFLMIVGLAIVLGITLIVLAIKYDEKSTIKIRDDELILGSRLIEWKDIDDIKF